MTSTDPSRPRSADQDASSERLAPEEAFWLLGHEIRIRIICALFDAERTADSGRRLFSELRERVGNPDSGRFTYHLNRLNGTFVRETEGRYSLTDAGCEVCRLLDGVDRTHLERSRPAWGECLYCETAK